MNRSAPSAVDEVLGIHVVLAMTIRRHRERRGLRQIDLADQLGWPLSRVTRIEGGVSFVKVVDLPALSKVFGMTLADLVRGANPEELRPMGLFNGAPNPSVAAAQSSEPSLHESAPQGEG